MLELCWWSLCVFQALSGSKENQLRGSQTWRWKGNSLPAVFVETAARWAGGEASWRWDHDGRQPPEVRLSKNWRGHFCLVRYFLCVVCRCLWFMKPDHLVVEAVSLDIFVQPETWLQPWKYHLHWTVWSLQEQFRAVCRSLRFTLRCILWRCWSACCRLVRLVVTLVLLTKKWGSVSFYLNRGGLFSPASVYWFVSRIAQKLLNGFSRICQRILRRCW